MPWYARPGARILEMASAFHTHQTNTSCCHHHRNEGELRSRASLLEALPAENKEVARMAGVYLLKKPASTAGASSTNVNVKIPARSGVSARQVHSCTARPRLLVPVNALPCCSGGWLLKNTVDMHQPVCSKQQLHITRNRRHQRAWSRSTGVTQRAFSR